MHMTYAAGQLTFPVTTQVPSVSPRPDFAAEIQVLLAERLGIGSKPAVGDDLIASGALDSLTLVQLLADLETHFGITVPLEDLEIDDIRSITALARLVAQRKFMTETL